MEGTEVEQRKVIAMARKLLLFPFPLQGHLTPMLHLANLLHSQGFSITFIQTRFNSLNPTRYPHFSFHFLDDRLPEGTVLTVENQAEIVPTIEANCREPFCVYLSQILTALAVDQDPFLCLISDQMWSFAGSVAQTFNLPRIALRTGGTAAWAVYESLPALRDKGYFSLQEICAKALMEEKGAKQQQRKLGRRLILFPLPFQGHVTPTIHLANLLHCKGFSITIIQTRYNALNPIHFPHFTFHFLDDKLPENYILSINNLKAFMSAIEANCQEPFRACLSEIVSADAEVQERVPCLISDPMWFFAGSVAESFNLPRIVMRTGGLSPLVVYDALPSLREKGYFPLQEAKLDEQVPQLPPLRVRDLPPEAHHDLLATSVKETKSSLGMICNTFEELESSSIARLRHDLPIPIFPIGPIHKYLPTSAASIWTEDQTCISWLNTQAPNTVLYVSFGSLAAVTESEFLEIAWGLANSKQPFLWVVRTGLSQDLELNDVLPRNYIDIVGERGHIVKWAPQLKVLSHPAVGGFWTHCGWNSTVESICEGVPMICLPFFADQGITARHISNNWKFGLHLEKGMGREEFERAIRQLMVEEGAEMRIRIAAMKEKAELCVMEGSSSYQSLESLASYLLSL